MKNENKKVVIVGGGASGMTAAISCKRSNPNYDVIILEKNFKLGRKILATGSGRCNITNKGVNVERYHTSSDSKELISNTFESFGYEKIENFLEEIGILIKEENRGRMFPRTDQSLTITKAFEEELGILDIKVEYNSKVISIEKDNNRFMVKCVDSLPSEDKSIKPKNLIIESDYVIISTGGMSYKDLGTTGDGYVFAKDLGHSLVENFPSITSLKIQNDDAKKIAGIRQEVNLKIEVNHKIEKEFYEEILYTDYGLSGSAVFQMSRFAIEPLIKRKDVNIILDFVSDKTEKELERYLLNKMRINPQKEMLSILLGFINYNLIEHLFTGLENKKCKNITEKDIAEIVLNLKNKKYRVTGYKEYEQAQVTTGGVNIDEINPKTLESKIVKGLYFCGEILDVDGDCGGFNLSWAWSSGFTAGKLK